MLDRLLHHDLVALEVRLDGEHARGLVQALDGALRAAADVEPRARQRRGEGDVVAVAHLQPEPADVLLLPVVDLCEAAQAGVLGDEARVEGDGLDAELVAGGVLLDDGAVRAEEDLADELVAEAGAEDADVAVVGVDVGDEGGEAEDPGVGVVGGGDGAGDEDGGDGGRVWVGVLEDVVGREGRDREGGSGRGGGEVVDVGGAVVFAVGVLDGGDCCVCV